MPGSRREVQYAEEEGVRFTMLAMPEAFLGGDTVAAVRVQRVHLGVADASGRQSPELIEGRSEEHTSELQSLMRISYAVFCLKKKKQPQHLRSETRLQPE